MKVEKKGNIYESCLHLIKIGMVAATFIVVAGCGRDVSVVVFCAMAFLSDA